jgi:hypothetical protein
MWFRRGDDGLTSRQRKKLAKRWRRVAEMPVSQEARDRARDPNREVLHLKRLDE